MRNRIPFHTFCCQLNHVSVSIFCLRTQASLEQIKCGHACNSDTIYCSTYLSEFEECLHTVLRIFRFIIFVTFIRTGKLASWIQKYVKLITYLKQKLRKEAHSCISNLPQKESILCETTPSSISDSTFTRPCTRRINRLVE